MKINYRYVARLLYAIGIAWMVDVHQSFDGLSNGFVVALLPPSIAITLGALWGWNDE